MSSSAVTTLFKNFWEWRLKEYPEFATFNGVHDYDGKLQSYSLKSIQNQKVAVQKFLKEASHLIQDPELSPEDSSNLEYFTSDLKTFLNGIDYKGYYFPICYLEGVHLEFERLLETMKCGTEVDYLKILERLSSLPCQISEIILLLKEGIKEKMTLHSISICGVLEQLQLLQKSVESTIFYKPFLSISEEIPFTSSTKEEIQSKAKKVIVDHVLPAFKELETFLEKEYFKHLRPNIAISSLDGGKEFYQSCLDFHLSCRMTPEEVHKTGLKEVERISKNMEKVIESLELKMSQREFSDHLRNENDFSFSNAEELFDAYKGAVFNLIEPQLPKLFNYLPKSKLEIVPSPLPSGPGAYYYVGTCDGCKPGTFYINTTKLKASPKYDVMTLALHEAMPGHHLQAYFTLENECFPDFRRYMEDRRYTEAPSLFPFHTAYVEGWGLYSEYLGYELGVYDDAYLEYGHLSYEMLRACRLVVDTGVHIFGWSREQAIDYMLNHTAKSKSGVEREVNRYITWPGQACGYKIGELKIKDLREQAEKALGSKFDIRKFHDVILQSYGPLNLMEKRVSEFIIRCQSSDV